MKVGMNLLVYKLLLDVKQVRNKFLSSERRHEEVIETCKTDFVVYSVDCQSYLLTDFVRRCSFPCTRTVKKNRYRSLLTAICVYTDHTCIVDRAFLSIVNPCATLKIKCTNEVVHCSSSISKVLYQEDIPFINRSY